MSLFVQEDAANKPSSTKYLSSILTIPESVLTDSFLQLDLRFHVVGLPATGLFLSTSVHYLE